MRNNRPVTMRLLAAALLLAGCSSPTQGGRTLTMTKYAGDGQSAVVSASVGTPPAVRILDDAFEPAEGVMVTFRVVSGGGTVSGGDATTDANGVARAGGWLLGPNVGANSMSATASGVIGSPLSFTATGTAAGGGGGGGGNLLREK